MSKAGEERGIGADPPEWWLKRFRAEFSRREEANEKARAAREPKPYKLTTAELGVRLADLVGRSEDWNHSVVSNFLNGKRYTLEMAEAFSIEFGIPRFEKRVRAETEEAANELELLIRKIDTLNARAGSSRVAAVDEEAARLTREARATTRPPADQGVRARKRKSA